PDPSLTGPSPFGDCPVSVGGAVRRCASMSDVLTGRDGAVLTVTLHRPEKLNALTAGVHAGLHEALAQAADDEIRAVALTGAGRGFCVGQDLTEFQGAAGDVRPPPR